MDGDEQAAPGGDAGGGAGQEGDQVESARRRSAVDVEGGHQVEGAGRQGLGGDVEDQGPDAPAQARPPRPVPQAPDGGGGQVHTGDLPAASGEPQGVVALAAADVEGGAGIPVGGQLRQPVVGLARPQAVHGGVARLPLLLTLTHGARLSAAQGLERGYAQHPHAAAAAGHRPRPRLRRRPHPHAAAATAGRTPVPGRAVPGPRPPSLRGPRRRRLSKSVAKARIEPERRKRNVDIPRFCSPPISPRRAFATDSDTNPPRTAPGAPCAPPRARPSAPS